MHPKVASRTNDGDLMRQETDGGDIEQAERRSGTEVTAIISEIVLLY